MCIRDRAQTDGIVPFFFCRVDQTEIPVEIPSGKLCGTWPELLSAAGAAEIIMRRIRHVGNADGVDTVSYTHLDVYKRQGKMKDTMERAKLKSELDNLQRLVDRIPPDILAELKRQQRHTVKER